MPSHTIAVRPIRTETDYEAALVEIDALMAALAGTPDGDRLDVLVTLVQAYEARHHQITPPDPIDAIRFRMEQQGLRPRDLEPYIGSRGRVSEVLHRRRALTLPMIRRLTEGLQIAAEVLVREPAGRASTRTARKSRMASARQPAHSANVASTATKKRTSTDTRDRKRD